MNNSESAAEIHFILDYLPLQSNLRVLKINKRGKTRRRGEVGRDSKMQRQQETDRSRKTSYTQEHCGESLIEDGTRCSGQQPYQGVLAKLQDYGLHDHVCFQKQTVILFWKEYFSVIESTYLSMAPREEELRQSQNLDGSIEEVRKNLAKMKVSQK